MLASVVLHALLLCQIPGNAPDKLEFDVASVKPNPSGFARGGDRPTANFPLGPGDVYAPNGGYFAASNYPLVAYIVFAYKIQSSQSSFLIPQLPKWAMTDGFDIKARAAGNPTKDEMREMMRALLAERFQLKVHRETRQVALFALTLVKPDKTGPQLRAHGDDAGCAAAGSETARAPAKPADEFPPQCGGIFAMPPTTPGSRRIGARKVTMDLIANALTGFGNLGRPVVDNTGLKGIYDFSLEWTPDRPLSVNGDLASEPSGPSFAQALRERLGLKLESQKGPFDVIVIDHVEHPSEN